AYSFDQLQQVAELAARFLQDLQEEFDQERATMAASIAKLQAQVNKLSEPKLDDPPSPCLMTQWIGNRSYETLSENCVSTCSQGCPADPPGNFQNFTLSTCNIFHVNNPKFYFGFIFYNFT
ncbi:hypothetical protein DSO57_1021955, partial [Entomophthora muscae]